MKKITSKFSNSFRQLLAYCLLLMAAALPLHAWALDSDGDGVDDSLDAFPNNAEATIDTDHDGKPDSINWTLAPGLSAFALTAPFITSGSWSSPSAGTASATAFGKPYPSAGPKLSISVRVGAGGGRMTYRVNLSGSGTLYTTITGKETWNFNYGGGGNPSYAVPEGFYTFSWELVGPYCTYCGIGSNGTASLSNLVSSNIKTSVLTEDADDDGDGIADINDAFPLDASESLDTDKDGIGNNADTDDDGDSVADVVDNCPLTVNSNQLNTDADAQGDACDSDDDNDGVADASDQFPLNAAASVDGNNDGLPDLWNSSYACAMNARTCNGLTLDLGADPDGDGILNSVDNCVVSANSDQLDTDGDGLGNACDSDDDNDGVVDTSDNCSLLSNANQQDVDADGMGDVCDAYPLLAPAGSKDVNFNPGASGYVRALIVQADGKLVISGNFTKVNGVARNFLARLNADGSVDTGFDPGVNGEAMAMQTDGKLVMGGVAGIAKGVARYLIDRLNVDGSVDTSFNPGMDTAINVHDLAVQADGKLVIGGEFTSVNGVSRNRVARLNADGSLDTSFNPGTGVDGSVDGLAVQADGKLVIGGGFASVNGVARNRVARLNADGSLDTNFNPGAGANYSVGKIAVQADGKLVIGGGFTSVNGVARNYIARLNADGSLDTSFNPGTGASSTVCGLALQADNKILIGGNFTSVNGVARNRIARLNGDGSVDTGFDPGTGASGVVYALAVQADGKLVIGGAFTSYNVVTANNLVRVHTGDTDADDVQDAADAFANNAASVLDADHDGLADAWLQPNAYGCAVTDTSCNSLVLDTYVDALDSDGISAATDNCPNLYNPDQTDTDNDGAGDTCDSDDDGDGFLDGYSDTFPLNAAASVDGDSDGLPDRWNQPNPSGCVATDTMCNGLTLDPTIPQTISVTQAAPASAVYASTFTVAATASSGLPVNIAGSGGCTGSGSGSVSLNMISGTTACTVTYSQTGDSSYNPAKNVNSTTTASKATQSITVTQPAPASAAYGSTFTVAATSSSGLTVVVSNSGGCSRAGSVLTMTSGTTTCTVTYSQAGDSNYSAATSVSSSTTASKASQTITETQAAPASAVYGSSFPIGATATSGLAVATTVSGGCSISGNTVTMTSGTTDCTVTYAQAGNGNYNAASNVVTTIAAEKANQSISVTQAAPSSAAYNSSFTVAATASSGLLVGVAGNGGCSIVSNTVTMTADNCTLTYTQSGDANYNAATPLSSKTFLASFELNGSYRGGVVSEVQTRQ